MAHFKDHFSTKSDQYQRYRPTYPKSLFEYLASLCPSHECAWDCATGTGQAAMQLVIHFSQVIATDASEQQVNQLPRHPHLEGRVMLAEQVDFTDNSIDLITVAQALHWFDQTQFYDQAWRILKPNAIIAIWSYNLLSIKPAIDNIIQHYYHEIVGPYWPKERLIIERGYAPIPAPFDSIAPPEFAMSTHWRLADLLGYLATWSASKYYREAKGDDPLSLITPSLTEAWGEPDTQYPVHWPMQLLIGQKKPASC